ncbi:MAG: hypothetical protein HYZ74_02115 [Elusimicrobia bacterium]|nr:hypothetical protein [Elusimicrobiota bacterium]
MSTDKRRRHHRIFDAVFAFFLCILLYFLVLMGSVCAPLYIGGPKVRGIVAFVLMPLDVLMLGWNQNWRILSVHVITTLAAFVLSKSSTDAQFRLMLVAYATCCLVNAVNDAIKAYRHPVHPPAPADHQTSPS